MPYVGELQKKTDETNNRQVKRDRIINNVTFFGDSAIPEGDPIYNSVWEAARLLAKNGYTIVNGGGPGIMKAATDGAESVNGNTIAVYWEPKLAAFFEGRNLANKADIQEIESNYLMRTLGLIDNGDVFVVCKGGTGTISEFGLVWCLAKLYYGCHKPVILYGDFWDDLIVAIQKAMNIDEIELAVLHRADTPKKLLDLIKSYELAFAHCVRKPVFGDESAFLLNGRAEMTVKNYNKIASEYKVHVKDIKAKEQLDDFIRLVNPPARVLDIGVGTGMDISYLKQKYSVVGIEPVKRFQQISQFENPDCKIENLDIVSGEIGEGVYKGIWARDSLHHIEEKYLDEVFKKISKALVEGGIFYCIVREGKGEIVEKEVKSYGNLERFYHLFTASELIERAEKAGMELIKVNHVQRSHRWLVGVFRKVA
ncbi:methyltransferase domain-containing protein [Candidatus Dojkabacteria bacterium]|uniref:Methyltransferase domain-containing protein n=1 Tax=Candidatus Dojkabacteria bacterium TaxID=2099670 RepID=A0A3M0Z0X6_9BACT|nr:MAG: methyltransferase domain-containing protein [Candidatus Dojkabacteria bacterium]